MSLVVTELTPRGTGAVTVLRFSGSAAGAAVQRLCSRLLPDVQSFAWTRIVLDGEVVDEALVCATATGEYELQLHGSPALVRRLRTHVEKSEQVSAVSRTRTVEERAIDAASRAPSEAGARMLLDQGAGAFRDAVLALRVVEPPARREAVAALLDRGRIARFTLHPARIVIAGPVNAGKSTLFNVLVGERRVVVSDQPGTTRDVIRHEAALGAYPILLSDTAGAREVSGDTPVDRLERTAQMRGCEELRGADLVLWLQRIDDPRDPRPSIRRSGARALVVRSHADRAAKGVPHRDAESGAGVISALHSPEQARAEIEREFRDSFELPLDPWVPGSAVPFDAEGIALLQELAEASSQAAADRCVRALLDGSDEPSVASR